MNCPSVAPYLVNNTCSMKPTANTGNASSVAGIVVFVVVVIVLGIIAREKARRNN